MFVPVVAVDFGASSIRVCRVELGEPGVGDRIEVVHRYEHGPIDASDGHLRWDWERLVAEMDRGIELARAAGPVASIGIDTWGVDYGLLDRTGALLEPPYCYRDRRTDGYRSVVDRVGERALYEIAGLQLLPFNTIFQLAAHDRSLLDQAAQVVLLPELLVHHLTGETTAERTSAGTTGLLDLATGDWSDELCDAIALDRAKLPPIRQAGTEVGRWQGTPVHLVGGHDTASAVAAGAVDGDAFVASGTWLLVGRERATPDTSKAAAAAGFTNELGALGGIRYLRNVAGWWLLDECRRRWPETSVAALLDDARSAPGGVALIDATDGRFIAPTDMEAEIRTAARLGDAPRPTLVRCIVESMAASTAAVIDDLGQVNGVRVFGGGARSDLYREALAARTGLPVHQGAAEATALGNALVQGVAMGVYESLADARRAL